VYLKLLPFTDLDERAVAAKFSPVSQMKYLIDYPSRKIHLYNKHKEELSVLATIRSDPQVSIIKIIDAIGKGHKNIIYCRSKDKAIELALAFAEGKPKIIGDKDLEKLADSIETEIHDDCYLAELIRKGIGYHVGYLPASIRMRIEDLYKEGGITTLFCTSTLVEGVNLPADNLFITSYQNGRPTMTDVDFANLVGRVGRIEYNLYGNVFLTRMEDNRDNKIEKFQEFLHGKVSEQKLSILSELTDGQKTRIVDRLKQGNMEFVKYPDDQSEENYQLMRKN
jgi:replicative superfamily II helicase